MKWSDEAWARIQPIYQKILDLDFNTQLANGTLDKEKFKFYMAQDAYYLGEFGKALSAISSRMRDLDDVLAYSNFATGAIVVERALHEGYFKTLGVPDDVKPTPTCLLYTNFLLNHAAYSSVEVALAAVLPCFWIYKRVGDYIYELQQDVSINPYKEWIDTYAGEEFASSVERAISITDKLADSSNSIQKESMHLAFERATKLEWMFWDSAFKMEKWPI
ncbi:TenA family protein [Belliella kenyensis]|uniref:TenA family protein n=1 Tax=Belliella kenyensis TaxID=1472724 RepID=A0ABV8EGJ1_9BACT|nr:TenA family protein [Belliella kenyensis]MCH7401766.1 TenA family protein [Belliella kenyensis]MDN3604265.1 TenA family protein [Belliella kenyensis]